jgi:hypothetical protein
LVIEQFTPLSIGFGNLLLRTNTKNMALPSFECVLCSLQAEETLEHLFPECSFAQSTWGLLNLNLPLGSHFEILESFKAQLGVNFFMDIIIMLSCASGWKEMTSFLKTSNRLSLQ